MASTETVRESASDRKKLSERIAERLRRARELAGMSQTVVAERLGIAANTVSGWESGERMPRAPDLRRLTEVYACTADFLLGRAEYATSLPVGGLLVDQDVVERVRAAKSQADLQQLVDWDPQMISFWQIVKPGTQVQTLRQVQALTIELTGHLRKVAPELWYHFEQGAREMHRRKRQWDKQVGRGGSAKGGSRRQ